MLLLLLVLAVTAVMILFWISGLLLKRARLRPRRGAHRRPGRPPSVPPRRR